MAWVVFALGCAAGSPGPRGPMVGKPGLSLGGDFATATPDEVLWGDVGVFPRRVEARIAVTSWLDLGGDLGWLDAAADVRVGLPAAPERLFAFNLAAGHRTGELGLFKDAKRARSYWVRLEAYPLLHSSTQPHGGDIDRASTTSGRAVSAIGLNRGTFYHDHAYQPDPDDEGWGPPEHSHYDDELRLEVAAGYHFRGRHNTWIQAVVQPYAVIDGDAPKHFWGLMIVLNGGAFIPFQTTR